MQADEAGDASLLHILRCLSCSFSGPGFTSECAYIQYQQIPFHFSSPSIGKVEVLNISVSSKFRFAASAC